MRWIYFAVMIILLLISGCAANRNWINLNVSEEQRFYDSRACWGEAKRLSQTVDYTYQNPSKSIGYNIGLALISEVFNQSKRIALEEANYAVCMRRMGYHHEQKK